MDREEVDLLRTLIVEMSEAIADKYSSSFWPYAPGSLASEEARSVDTDLVNTVLEQVEAAIDSAGQHLTALSRALDPSAKIVVVPAYTLSRTVLEACARSAWVLDPGVDALERFSRSLVLLLEERRGEVEIAKARFGSAAPETKRQEEAWSAESEKIFEKAESVRIALQRNNKGRVTKVGGHALRVRSTVVVKQALYAEEAYRVLSGLEHQRTYRQRDMTTRAVPIPGTQHVKRERSMSEDQLRWLTRSVIRWYGMATWRSFAYSGYDLGWMAKTLREAAQVVDLREDVWQLAGEASDPFPE